MWWVLGRSKDQPTDMARKGGVVAPLAEVFEETPHGTCAIVDLVASVRGPLFILNDKPADAKGMSTQRLGPSLG